MLSETVDRHDERAGQRQDNESDLKGAGDRHGCKKEDVEEGDRHPEDQLVEFDRFVVLSSQAPYVRTAQWCFGCDRLLDELVD